MQIYKRSAEVKFLRSFKVQAGHRAGAVWLSRLYTAPDEPGGIIANKYVYW